MTSQNPIGPTATRNRGRNQFHVPLTILMTRLIRRRSGRQRDHLGTTMTFIVPIAISSRTTGQLISPALGPNHKPPRINLSIDIRRRTNQVTEVIGTITRLDTIKIDLGPLWSPRGRISRIINTWIIIHRVTQRAATASGSSYRRIEDIPSLGRGQSRSTR